LKPATTSVPSGNSSGTRSVLSLPKEREDHNGPHHPRYEPGASGSGQSARWVSGTSSLVACRGGVEGRDAAQ
jgi:hypothetical protein